MRMFEVWSVHEVRALERRLRGGETDIRDLRGRTDATTDEERSRFLGLMYGSGPTEAEIEAEEHEKQRLENQRTRVELDQLMSATAREADRLDGDLMRAKILQTLTDVGRKADEITDAAP